MARLDNLQTLVSVLSSCWVQSKGRFLSSFLLVQFAGGLILQNMCIMTYLLPFIPLYCGLIQAADMWPIYFGSWHLVPPYLPFSTDTTVMSFRHTGKWCLQGIAGSRDRQLGNWAALKYIEQFILYYFLSDVEAFGWSCKDPAYSSWYHSTWQWLTVILQTCSFESLGYAGTCPIYRLQRECKCEISRPWEYWDDVS